MTTGKGLEEQSAFRRNRRRCSYSKKAMGVRNPPHGLQELGGPGERQAQWVLLAKPRDSFG